MAGAADWGIDPRNNEGLRPSQRTLLPYSSRRATEGTRCSPQRDAPDSIHLWNENSEPPVPGKTHMTISGFTYGNRERETSLRRKAGYVTKTIRHPGTTSAYEELTQETCPRVTFSFSSTISRSFENDEDRELNKRTSYPLLAQIQASWVPIFPPPITATLVFSGVYIMNHIITEDDRSKNISRSCSGSDLKGLKISFLSVFYTVALH